MCLFWHAMIHAGAIALITHSVVVALIELVCHMLIDWAKCEGKLGEGTFSFIIDQSLHVNCKIAYAIMWVN